MKRVAALIILLVVALPACADSITLHTFALQENPVRFEALGRGLDPLLAPVAIHGGRRGLVFDTSIDPIGSVVFSSTISLLGVQYTFGPMKVRCSATCGVGYGFLLPISYKMVQGTLSLTLNGVTETYDFRYQSPVPEPGAVLLLGTGLIGIAWRKYVASDKKRERSGELSIVSRPRSIVRD